MSSTCWREDGFLLLPNGNLTWDMGCLDSTSREARRNYALPDGSRIQMFTALVLFIVQGSSGLPPPLESETSLPVASPPPKSAGPIEKKPHRGFISIIADSRLWRF